MLHLNKNYKELDPNLGSYIKGMMGDFEGVAVNNKKNHQRGNNREKRTF